MCTTEDVVGNRLGRRLPFFTLLSWAGILAASAQDLIDKAIGLDVPAAIGKEPAGDVDLSQVPLPPGMFQRPRALLNAEVIPDIEEAWDEYEEECEAIQGEITKFLANQMRNAPNVKELQVARNANVAWSQKKALPETEKCKKWKKDFEKHALALESRYRDLEKKYLKHRPDLATRLFEERISIFKPWMKGFRQAGPQGDWLFFSSASAKPEWRTIDPPVVGGPGDEGSGNDSKNNKFSWRLGDEHLTITWDDGRPKEGLELIGLHKGCATTKLGSIIENGPFWVRLSEVDSWPQTPGVWESPNPQDPNRWLRFVREGWVFENQDLQASWKWKWKQRPQENPGQNPVIFELFVPQKDRLNRVVLGKNGKPNEVCETYRIETDADGVEVCRRLDGINQGGSAIGGYRPGQRPKAFLRNQ